MSREKLITDLNQFGDIQLQSQLTDKIRNESHKVVFFIRSCNIMNTSYQHSLMLLQQNRTEDSLLSNQEKNTCVIQLTSLQYVKTYIVSS